jgi:hypothetical protein
LILHRAVWQFCIIRRMIRLLWACETVSDLILRSRRSRRLEGWFALHPLAAVLRDARKERASQDEVIELVHGS